VFNGDGAVESGPAPKPLAWFLVTLSKDNRLLVDKGEPVHPDKYLIL
jgi:Rieske Fe-S protein